MSGSAHVFDLNLPTNEPSNNPTRQATDKPSDSPTREPINQHSSSPTNQPTDGPEPVHELNNQTSDESTVPSSPESYNDNERYNSSNYRNATHTQTMQWDAASPPTVGSAVSLSDLNVERYQKWTKIHQVGVDLILKQIPWYILIWLCYLSFHVKVF
jgi:hypothetical protein